MANFEFFLHIKLHINTLRLPRVMAELSPPELLFSCGIRFAFLHIGACILCTLMLRHKSYFYSFIDSCGLISFRDTFLWEAQRSYLHDSLNMTVDTIIT